MHTVAAWDSFEGKDTELVCLDSGEKGQEIEASLTGSAKCRGPQKGGWRISLVGKLTTILSMSLAVISSILRQTSSTASSLR